MSDQYAGLRNSSGNLGLTEQIQSETSREPSVLSVEQLNLHVKQLIEGQMAQIWVQGEISNFKAHTSGHFYFSLKDSKSQISAVMFRGFNSKLRFKPHDGLEVIVRGRITVYEPRGSYQIMCDSMEPVGAGALQKAFEDLKQKLRLEGLFDPKRKKAIPVFPQRIAIVTSLTGAAIRDMLNVLGRRAKNIEVFVVPTLVQGASASPQIIEALKKAEKLPQVDVIVLARGGGSIEDMWCFNDEALARAIASCPIPTISAVGHEIDFTIADFVADLRAPTPSAAAELVSKSGVEVANRLQQQERLLRLGMSKILRSLGQRLELNSRRLVDPQRRLQDLQIRRDELISRLELAMGRQIERKQSRVLLVRERMGSPMELVQRRIEKNRVLFEKLNRAMGVFSEKKRLRLEQRMSVLDSLSPLKVVDRGYSILQKKDLVVKRSQDVQVGDQIRARLSEGELELEVLSKK